MRCDTTPETAKQILIVDDDEDARDVLGELVAAFGHRPLRASSASEALDHAERHTVDLALIDIGLPGTDGYEVARRIRRVARGASVKLVALTGYSDEVTRRQAAAAGFDAFLVKPAHASALEALLVAASAES